MKNKERERKRREAIVAFRLLSGFIFNEARGSKCEEELSKAVLTVTDYLIDKDDLLEEIEEWRP